MMPGGWKRFGGKGTCEAISLSGRMRDGRSSSSLLDAKEPLTAPIIRKTANPVLHGPNTCAGLSVRYLRRPRARPGVPRQRSW